MSNLATLAAAADKARARSDRLTARYNRDYAAGKFTTNRRLAGQCEDAYSDACRAEAALAAAQEA